MHLLIPFASALSEACAHTLRDLKLPVLTQLLSRLQPTLRDSADEYSLSPPHERALAAAWGWAGADGALPWAAQHAAADGLAVRDLAWGELTPVHWHVGRDHISLADPAGLHLAEDESRALLESIRPLFESLGWTLAWGQAARWYVAHDSLDGLPCAALDRVIGRNVDLWLQSEPLARDLRRMQAEVQMLLYQHPVNDEREARGELSVNSFWLSGCGRAQHGSASLVDVDLRLRGPVLAEDWAAWADAGRSLDDSTLADALALAERGNSVTLTLCGERSAQRFEAQPRSLWQRLGSHFRPVAPDAMLEAL